MVRMAILASAGDGVEQVNEAVAGVSIQTLVIFIVSSSAFTTVLSYWLTRRKNTADATKTEAEADNIVAATFNEVIEALKAELIRQEEVCGKRIDQMEEDFNRELNRANERIEFLESREEQATAHIKNLEEKLRELGVPLPPTPWRAINFRRRYGRGNQSGGTGDSSS